MGRVIGVVAILPKLGRKGIMRNLTFEQNPERNEEMIYEDIWGKPSQQVQKPEGESVQGK